MNADERTLELLAAKAQRERSTSNLLDHLASLVNVAVTAIKKEYKLVIVVCLLACLPVCAFGQTPAKPATKPVPTICADKSKDCAEALKLENLDLKIGKIVDEFNTQAQKQFEQMVKPQMQPLQDERTKLVQKLNAAHPGYQWHDATGPGDIQGFQPVPATSTPGKPPAPAMAPAKPIDKPAASQ